MNSSWYPSFIIDMELGLIQKHYSTKSTLLKCGATEECCELEFLRKKRIVVFHRAHFQEHVIDMIHSSWTKKHGQSSARNNC